MTARPVAVLAMIPGVDHQILTPSARAELLEVVDLAVPDAVDLAALDDGALDRVEIVLGSWGCSTLDATLLARMPKLRLLAYAAGTVKTTVTDATWSHGVHVSSAAAANAIPVAELTFAAIVMIAKDVFRIRDQHRQQRGTAMIEGRGPAGAVGTRGLRVGVVGASHIGRLVVERLRTLDVDAAVNDPHVAADDARALGVETMSLEDLFAWADVVTLHAPALPETRHLVDAPVLACLHDGAWLINTARGSLVDTDALTAECSAGRIGAFIDTSEPEPLPPDSPLYDLPNVVLTPHIAGSLGTELSRLGDHAVAEIARFVRGEPLHHPVHEDDLGHIA